MNEQFAWQIISFFSEVLTKPDFGTLLRQVDVDSIMRQQWGVSVKETSGDELVERALSLASKYPSIDQDGLRAIGSGIRRFWPLLRKEPSSLTPEEVAEIMALQEKMADFVALLNFDRRTVQHRETFVKSLERERVTAEKRENRAERERAESAEKERQYEIRLRMTLAISFLLALISGLLLIIPSGVSDQGLPVVALLFGAMLTVTLQALTSLTKQS